MAERKYELIVQQKYPNSRVSKKSWYNEQVRTKYLKQQKPGEKVQSFDTKNWLFLRRGLDDFRDGLPPIGSLPAKAGNVITKSGLSPLLQNDFVKIADLNTPPAMKRLKQYQTYLSKYSPHKQQLGSYIASVEEGLLRHPLALYPHLEQSVAPEIFGNILDILDPQFSTLDIQEEELDILGKMDEENENITMWSNLGMSVLPAEEEKPKLDQTLGLDASVRNMYRWVPQKESAKNNKKSKEKEKLWPTSVSEEEHIKHVTREFCDWVADLGGDTNNIEESTITSLFASGYDTKPALSVPIHVVDLSNVPHELRLSAMVPPPAPAEKQIPVVDQPKKEIKGEYEPTFVKFRYGAWYLKPNTWKKMGYFEPLEDPKQLKEHEMSDAKKKCHELTEELSTMHASKAFDEFIAKKNTRKPEFLAEIADIQKMAAIEEQKRAESELLAKQKKYPQKNRENLTK